jgi:membrane protein required for beta-lactamase induction
MKTIAHGLGSLIGGLTRLLGRLLKLPFTLVAKLLAVSFSLGRAVGAIPLRLTRRATRILGVRGVLFGLVGLAAGLLLAPMTGRELRKKLAAMLSASRPPSDTDLTDKVAFELSHAPRTWHLDPQPDVSVVAGRVILSGKARDDSAFEEFGRVAAAIPGVVEVDNQLVVTGD